MNNLSFHITDIMTNSIRAKASEIGLFIEERDLRITIRIADNGLGMDAGLLPVSQIRSTPPARPVKLDLASPS